MYTSEEFGYIALQCPEYEHLHVQSENVLVEVLDDHGSPCPPGAVGRLVITALHNFATPLIRYEIGDHAEVGTPCPCGRGLPVLSRVVGRTRNMVCLPGGERRWPVVGFREFREIAPIRQFQFIQKDLQTLTARLVADTALTLEQEERFAAVVQQAIGHPFSIELEYPGTIERGPRGKYEEFICQVPGTT
jgi:phenylacetate-CoA ligase